jgi:hypothetical protein
VFVVVICCLGGLTSLCVVTSWFDGGIEQAVLGQEFSIWLSLLVACYIIMAWAYAQFMHG